MIHIPLLLLAICSTETGLRNVNNYQDNQGPSYGICQLKISTARALYKHLDALSLQQEQVNFMVANRYLESLKTRYNGNLLKSISAYNAGTYTEKNFVYVDKVVKTMLQYSSDKN